MNSFFVNMPKKIHFNISLPTVCGEELAKYKNILLLLPLESMEDDFVINSVVRVLEENGSNIITKKIASELDDKSLDVLFPDLSVTDADAVLAIGGGSVIDAGKILSARYTNSGTISEILAGEVTFANKSLPLYVAPTTHSSAEANSIVSVCSEGRRT